MVVPWFLYTSKKKIGEEVSGEYFHNYFSKASNDKQIRRIGENGPTTGSRNIVGEPTYWNDLSCFLALMSTSIRQLHPRLVNEVG